MTAYLNALGVICALGRGKAEVTRRLLTGDGSAMQPYPQPVAGRRVPVGAVTCELPSLADFPQRHATRNNQMLLAAVEEIEAELHEAIARFGPARIGVVMGTSTTGIQEASLGIAGLARDGHLPASYHYAHQELCAPASFLSERLQLSGPSYAISTACTSSARALLSAKRLLDAGICDAVICGGVDTLCDLTLQGFSALEAVSTRVCNPFSANRDGINIGEAAAVFLMTREPAPIALLGGGASSDAHHISAPDPQGLGAIEAMRQALASASVAAEQISYLNLHGTATRHNDAMESLAVATVFPGGVACSSSKPLTGHTLGAAGALEAAFCWLALSDCNRAGLLPPHRWDNEEDADLPRLNLVTDGTTMAAAARRAMMSNSFAFGGNNISLILGDA
ncbi:beta-ketoacyl-[acyl-carrier-protein] synthase family protein [Pseudomonas sp. MTM4]|uniref:beta-ketoacyl-[acyl-carrier-protein] synthase family protein n=1 Tax=unclassified Pseudomonas TaxID=196821 RepID=UPI0018D26C63|nr:MULTISPECIES: beta-ketoacyl-[acyl-carrier-protein] synthase family protein [unclassified Pseudomonas]MBC8649733.1 beta-ketoacyl-[acyl-carrier-protein] synthase family protein [Pseudomonas sp. MT4]QXY92083.1 beta-ketoacyl-[acyl-carrier-protein] synthase family protein [Pseudomonas sp. MTM4]